MKVKPTKEGLKVPYPLSQRYLKAEGEKVPNSKYWRRRLKEKCVVEVDETKAPTGEKIKAPAKTSAKSRTNKMEVES